MWLKWLLNNRIEEYQRYQKIKLSYGGEAIAKEENQMQKKNVTEQIEKHGRQHCGANTGSRMNRHTWGEKYNQWRTDIKETSCTRYITSVPKEMLEMKSGICKWKAILCMRENDSQSIKSLGQIKHACVLHWAWELLTGTTGTVPNDVSCSILGQ